MWLTAAGAALAALSLVFKAELWPTSPRAQQYSCNVLLWLLLAGWCQALPVAWEISRLYTGPWLIRFLLQVGAVSFIGISTLLIPLIAALLLVY